MAASPEQDVSPDFPFDLQSVSIFGSDMRYVETQPDASTQSAPTALFIHGNGSSSYLWRNVIPHVSPLMRCVASDLIGMGSSTKPAHMPYRFTDHYTFLSAFISAVIPSGPIILVVHDWGAPLGLHWAYQQAQLSTPTSPPRIAGIALMEFVRIFADWDDFGAPDDPLRQAFCAFRTPDAKGRKLIVEQNVIVGDLLEQGSVRTLSEAELEHYQRPYLDLAVREPLYVWTNQVPLAGHPSDVHDIIARYEEWLLRSEVPKLMFWVRHGAVVTPELGCWYVENARVMKGVVLGVGFHYP